MRKQKGSMTLCKLIKKVLDEQYEEIHEPGRDEAVKAKLEQFSKVYASLKVKGAGGLDYSSPASRFAYIQRYTVAHGDYVRQVIARSRELKAVFNSDDIHVGCLGGGPGSDFLGILKYMMRAGKTGAVTCYLFDRERAWADSWSDVARLLKGTVPFYPSFAQMDAADPQTYKSYNRIKKCDLLTLSYFMSEMFKYREKVEPFFEHCFDQVRAGALVMYIDNKEPDFRDWFDALAGKHRMKILKSESCELSWENSEEKTDLGDYFKKFGWPKRTSQVDVRVAMKE